MEILRFAWRNLWRNTRRTLITLAAACMSTAILMVSYSLMDGLIRHAVDSATNMFMGEAQIHVPGYLSERSLYESLPHPQAILAAFEQGPVQAVARSYGFGLVAVGTKSAGATFWGMDPEKERQVFDLARHVARGRFLGPKAEKDLVLGEKLAKSLQAQVGSEVVVVVQAADGSLGNELFKVRGILKTVGDQVDRGVVLMHQQDFSQLFVSGGRIHEVALNSRGKVDLPVLAAQAQAAAPGQEVKTWRQLMPAISDMLNMFDAFIWVFGLIFALAAGLGVMNTMLMATFERIREIGIIKALGASRWRIMRDVTVESMLLAVMGTALGAGLGLAGSYYLQEVGLDISAVAGNYSVAGLAFEPIYRGTMSLKGAVLSVLMMWIVCLVATIYPAWLASRLDPVRAIQRP